MRKKIKNQINRLTSVIISLLVMISIILYIPSNAFSNETNKANGNYQSFTDVTDKFDNSNFVKSNFNKSVLTTKYASDGKVSIIVELKKDSLADTYNDENNISFENYASSFSGKNKINEIKSEQSSFLRTLKNKNISYDLNYSYSTVFNGLAITVDSNDIEKIEALSSVQNIINNEVYAAPTLANTNSSNIFEETGIYNTKDIKYQGDGMAVAILDTGMDYTHRAVSEDNFTYSKLKYSKNDIANIMSSTRAVELAKEVNGKKLSVDDLYISKKIPFAFDYADKDSDVYPSYSTHGTHVGGIVAGYDPLGEDKDGNLLSEPFRGVVPNAQLCIFKVFTDNPDAKGLGGAEEIDILAALEDATKLGVDVINMSLGSSSGFSTAKDEDNLSEIYENVRRAGISLVTAASNSFSSAYGSPNGTNLITNPDSATVGSPSTYDSSLSVASISGKLSSYFLANDSTQCFFNESNDLNNNELHFISDLIGTTKVKELEYVLIPGVGQSADFVQVRDKVPGRVALIKRGDISFTDKVNNARNFGAIGVIIYNNVSGIIRMSLADIELNNLIPSCSISMETGKAMVDYANSNKRIGKIRFDVDNYYAGPFMSDFSSWGPTPSLGLKPEITAHGGLITSSVTGNAYDEYSGTSMASPNMAGLSTILRQYISAEDGLNITNKNEIQKLVNLLAMSSAVIANNEFSDPYSPRKQGAGLANLENALSTKGYIYVKDDDGNIKDKTKLELGDDKEKTGVYELEFYVKNFSSSNLNFTVDTKIMTETIASDNKTIAEKSYMLDDTEIEIYTNGSRSSENITVNANSDLKIKVVARLSSEAKKYLKKFDNGMYVEGFVRLLSENAEQCNLNIPFLAFYGNWMDAPLFDYSVYEVAKSAQDDSVAEVDKLKEAVWKTSPYAYYDSEKEYIIPLGQYIYTQPDDELKVYADIDKCAISMHDNDNYSEYGNYDTTYGLYAIYAGLLRGAKEIEYKMVNEATGEVIDAKNFDYVRKASSNGGGTSPAYIPIEYKLNEKTLPNNTKYTVSLKGQLDDYINGESSYDTTNRNNFEFSFYTDYDAPILENYKLRYETKIINKKEVKYIYLDMQIYDNHYAQNVMLLFQNKDKNTLELMTEYPTPVYSERNSTTTVSIDITNLYEKYKGNFYVHNLDYAMNYSIYKINFDNAVETPTTLDIVEDNLTLSINEPYTLNVNMGSAKVDLSNLVWRSSNSDIVKVSNGRIVALKEGTATISCASKDTSVEDEIQITVRDSYYNGLENITINSISFKPVNNKVLAVVNPNISTVEIYPNVPLKLEIETDPWYASGYEIIWTSSNEKYATVDKNGIVTGHEKGKARITAEIKTDSHIKPIANCYVDVDEEFIVKNYTLKEYHGPGGDVVMPDNMNIMYIDKEAFKNNDNITSLVIAKTVQEIKEKAFYNCQNLLKVSLAENSELFYTEARAFSNCKSLTEIDFTNSANITLGKFSFEDCTDLSVIKGMDKIHTCYDYAFKGCTSLTTLDLSNLHVASTGIFYNCTGLKNVTFSPLTDIGSDMFYGCTSLNSVVVYSQNIGDRAFSESGITNFTLSADVAYLGNEVFKNCYKLSQVDFGTTRVVKLGNAVFKYCSELENITLPIGLSQIGSELFYGCSKLTSVKIMDDSDFKFDKYNVFSGCTSINRIEIEANSNKYNTVDGVLYSKDMTTLLYLPVAKTNHTLNASTTILGDSAFSGNSNIINIKDNKINFNDNNYISIDNITRISKYTFSGTSLTEVNLDGINQIDEGAFYNCIKLVAFNLTNSNLVDISSFCFYNNVKLSTVNTSNGINSIGDYAFYNSAIENIDFSNVVSIGEYAFAQTNKIVSLSSDTLESIGDYAFASSRGIKTINLPSLTSVGIYVFKTNENLETVTISKIETGMFMNDTKLKTVTLCNNVEEIKASAFEGCKVLETINLGNVTNIDDRAFYNTVNLLNVDLGNVESLGISAFENSGVEEASLVNAINIGDFAFYNSSLATLTLERVENIGIQAFFNTKLVSVVLPETLDYLGIGAFSSNKEMTKISVDENNDKFFNDTSFTAVYKYLPNGKYEVVSFVAGTVNQANVTKYTVLEGTLRVGELAFFGVQSLREVTLPWTMEYIGDKAFFECTNKVYIFLSENAPVLESYPHVAAYKVYSGLGDVVCANFQANFGNYMIYMLKDYSEYKNLNLTMKYPSNGIGYQNYTYRTYFYRSIVQSEVMDSETRNTKDLISNLPQINEIQALSNKTLQEVEAQINIYSEAISDARKNYNLITSDVQKEFIAEEELSHLVSCEREIKTIKNEYGLTTKIDRIKVTKAPDKLKYFEGESLDLTGIEITIYYVDGTTDIATNDMITVLDEIKLGVSSIKVQVGDKTARIAIEVEVNNGEDNVPGEDNPPVTKNNNALIIVIVIVSCLVLCGVVLLILIKTKVIKLKR